MSGSRHQAGWQIAGNMLRGRWHFGNGDAGVRLPTMSGPAELLSFARIIIFSVLGQGRCLIYGGLQRHMVQ